MTVDMDFLLRNKTNNIDAIVRSIEDIIKIQTDYNFIEFEFKGVEEIAVEKKYPGISVKLIGKIGNTKTPIITFKNMCRCSFFSYYRNYRSI